LKTVDQYFNGLRNDIQWANVHQVIDTIIRSLLYNDQRKFTYVEMAFFSRWYNLQTNVMKNITKMLVKQGRLQFVNCGWSMSDEANPTAEDLLLNMTIGNNWLYNELGYKCNVGWHIDPFGHSNFMAKNLINLNYD